MILCLDVGNTLIHGGIFIRGDLQLHFRMHTKSHLTSDELGISLKNILRENNIDPSGVQEIAFCTVVPTLTHSLKNCCRKYFGITPFILQAGVKTGLKIKYRNPSEVGSDRIANAIAATHLYPKTNLIIADLGTAITLCAISKHKDYLGGVIMPGMKISVEALESKTAQLPSVAIIKPPQVTGRTTVEGIQSGIYFGTLAMLRSLIEQMSFECFPNEDVHVIGTSGFSTLFENAHIFTSLQPHLVLKGLHVALGLNRETLQTTLFISN